MKNILLFLIMLASSIACQKDDNIGPPELLYQRWDVFQTKKIGDNAWISYDTDAQYDTEYRSDGMLLYRRNGVLIPANCCKPTQFSLNKTTISYNDPNHCPFSLCAGIPKTKETIEQLTGDLLELNDGTYITQYRSVK
ncbi:hypothetical protein [Spirosoma arcticum]